MAAAAALSRRGQAAGCRVPNINRWCTVSRKRHMTTVLCIRKDDQLVLMGDGQVSLGSTVMKPNALKVRRLSATILAGFAGSTADALTLIERLEVKLEEYPDQLTRAAVELAKDWRTDKYLRRLEAILIVADKTNSYTLTGNGDVIEPHDGIIGIGSGGTYALAAARALIDQDNLNAEEIAKKSMLIASKICVYTNSNFVMEKLSCTEEPIDNIACPDDEKSTPKTTK